MIAGAPSVDGDVVDGGMVLGPSTNLSLGVNGQSIRCPSQVPS